MSSSKALRGFLAAGAAVATLCAAMPASAAVTIIINNLNGPGVGFNDATPAVPVGGNAGTTVGQQRLNAFAYAANVWGANLTSSVPVVINAQFSALSCTATSATLGSAGATQVFREFANAPKSGTWYSYALANKIAGFYLGTLNAAQISANFNVNLGQANCLAGQGWYYGLDNNEGSQIDFVAVLLHEMGHGLGFQTFTSGTTGNFLQGFPAIWDHYLMDNANGILWKDMTAAQRVSSAIGVNRLVWTGANVTAGAPSVLRQGLPGVTISGPAAGPMANAQLQAGEASFGASLTQAGLFSEVMPVVSDTTSAAGTGKACGPLTVNDARAVNGKIALIDRGACGFVVKVKNAQNAGAVGVLIADNAAGPPAGLGGSDPTITIPAVRITLADGNSLKTQLATRSRTNSGVYARMGLFGTQLAGTDVLGRVLMYTPNPFVSGSSVSHYDTTATRNLLMEPSINGDLTIVVVPPIDLTLPLFTDIGW